jgi:hypothetical protein
LQCARALVGSNRKWNRSNVFKRLEIRPVRLAYQPPANITFLLEQISHQQPAAVLFSQNKQARVISHRPNEQADTSYINTWAGPVSISLVLGQPESHASQWSTVSLLFSLCRHPLFVSFPKCTPSPRASLREILHGSCACSSSGMTTAHVFTQPCAAPSPSPRSLPPCRTTMPFPPLPRRRSLRVIPLHRSLPFPDVYT